MNAEKKPEYSCLGGCGKKSENPEHQGWELLPITGRYRCGACSRELEVVGRKPAANFEQPTD